MDAFGSQSRRSVMAGMGGLALAAAGSGARAQTAAAPAFHMQALSKAGPDRVHAMLEDLTKRSLFSGNVLIASREKVVFRRAYGLASREYGYANNPETLFNLASAGKMFTAAVIGRLQDEGKLGFDDPVSKHLDETWLAEPYASEVTITHLLTHTGGIVDYFKPNGGYEKTSRRLLRDIKDFKPLLEPKRLDFDPGKEWRYSNSGYLLLGAIIEKLRGRPYAEVIAQEVLQPSGMTRSGIIDLENVVPNYAQGYSKVPTGPLPPPPPMPGGRPVGPPTFEDLTFMSEKMQPLIDSAGFKWINNHFRQLIQGGPAGGSMGTLDDMDRFMVAISSGRIIRPETWRRMTTFQKPPASHWALGFTDMGGGVGHGGTFFGVSTHVGIYPDGSRLIILSNVDNGGWLASAGLLRLAGRTPKI